MIILSLYLSKGPKMDPYLYCCRRRESVPRYLSIVTNWAYSRLRGGLRKRLYMLPNGSAGSGHLQLILG
jgi:hypothetical protein